MPVHRGPVAQAPTLAVEAFLATYRNAKTRDLHRLNLVNYWNWLEGQSLTTLMATDVDVIRFLDHKRAGRKDSTVDTILKSIRAYYKWAIKSGALDHNPALDIPTLATRTNTPRFVPVEDLRLMLQAANKDRDWAFIAILAFSSLQPAALLACDATDFEFTADRTIVHLRHAEMSERRRLPYTVLAPNVARVLQAQLSGRRQGPLFVNRFGGRLAATGGRRIVLDTAERAGITYRVSPQMLTHSLPALALQHGFSYRSVIRAMGIPDRRHSERWLTTAGQPSEDNASVRLAHLVELDHESSEFLLTQAEALLTDMDLPEAFAVASIGAVVERHLRALADEQGVAPARDQSRGNITYYLGELQRRGTVTVTDARRFLAIADIRNDAAHGWFDRVAPASGFRVLREARALIDRYPSSSLAKQRPRGHPGPQPK